MSVLGKRKCEPAENAVNTDEPAKKMACPATGLSVITEYQVEEERLQDELFFNIDNPHPAWFGSRPLLSTATRVSEHGGLSEYTRPETDSMKFFYYSDYKLQSNGHMQRGVFQERHILEVFCRRMGLRLLKVPLLIHPQSTLNAATPDGLGSKFELPPAEEWPAIIWDDKDFPCRLAAEPGGELPPDEDGPLGAAGMEGLLFLAKCKFWLFDLEAKCPVQPALKPSPQYICQMGQQLDVTELDKAYLITHSANGTANIWKETRSPPFMHWLHRMSHRAMQYEACGVSNGGYQVSSRGMRGFEQGPSGAGPRRPMCEMLVPNMIPNTEARLQERLASPGQTDIADFFRPCSPKTKAEWASFAAPMPPMRFVQTYHEPLKEMPHIKW